MRTLVITAFLVCAFQIIAPPVFAQPGHQNASGQTPAQSDICDPLKADGVTKGLFGLCVAYCEAGSDEEDLLAEYNQKRTEDDPPMPCACPCWDAVEGLEGAIKICSTGPELAQEDIIYFAVFGPDQEIYYEAYGVGPGLENPVECAHVLIVGAEPPIDLREPVDSAVEQVCRQNLRDADDDDCL